MTKLLRIGGLLAALFFCTGVHAGVYAGDIQIQNAWARATAPGQDAASVDLTITSKHAAALTGVSSPVAKSAELHSMKMEGGMMKMREVASIELPPGETVNLGKSGYHLMLVGLKAPLREGDTVPLTLTIRVSKLGAVKVMTQAAVSSLTATSPPPGNSGHHQMDMQMH
ncbi:MAG: copper chaperone PCu(A)C [Gallionella sp.]